MVDRGNQVNEKKITLEEIIKKLKEIKSTSERIEFLKKIKESIKDEDLKKEINKLIESLNKIKSNENIRSFSFSSPIDVILKEKKLVKTESPPRDSHITTINLIPKTEKDSPYTNKETKTYSSMESAKSYSDTGDKKSYTEKLEESSAIKTKNYMPKEESPFEEKPRINESPLEREISITKNPVDMSEPKIIKNQYTNININETFTNYNKKVEKNERRI